MFFFIPKKKYFPEIIKVIDMKLSIKYKICGHQFTRVV